MYEMLSLLTWQDWATAVGVIFGIISLIAYWEQRRANKQQEILVEFAKRHVDKDISADELRKLAEQRAALEGQITQHIPSLARAAVLKEQAEMHAHAIAGHYKEWLGISQELKPGMTGTGLDPALEKVVLDRILPRYELQERREQWRTRVTILSVSMAIISSVLPYPLYQFVSYALAVPLAGALLRLASLHDGSAVSSKRVRYGAYAIYFTAATFILGFGFLLLLSPFERVAGSVIAALGLVLALLFPVVRKRLDVYLAR